MSSTLEARIKARAVELGFDLVGITSSEPSAFAEEYRNWIGSGYAGEMDYLARSIERRTDPGQLLPDTRSIIVVGMNYYTKEEGKKEMEGPGDGETGRGDLAVFALYARGDDYHHVMTARLRALLEYLKSEAGPEAAGRVYVDTGPVLEREVARRAGLGWFGKNTMLINTRRGSYFFLGEIVTNVPLTPDEPAVGGCGTCTRCLDACPTDAFVAPFVLDSRRCISYLTIELKGSIPEEFIPAISVAGNRVYGCDICQEVCPFNTDREEGRGIRDQKMQTGRQGDGENLRGGEWESERGGDLKTAPCRTGGLSPAEQSLSESSGTDTFLSPARNERLRERLGEGDTVTTSEPTSGDRSVLTPNTEHLTPAVHGSYPTTEPAFQPRPYLKDLKDVKDLLYLTQEEFSAAFKGSAVKRAKRRGLLRNAIAALAGRDDSEAIAALEHALDDPEELLREVAEWALGHITERKL